MRPDGEGCFQRYFTNVSQQRLIVYGIILLSVIVAIILLITLIPGGDSAEVPKKEETGRDALTKTPLIDGCNNLAEIVRNKLGDSIKKFPFGSDLSNNKEYSWCSTDVPRLKKGLVGAQVWNLNVDCDASYKDAPTRTIQQLDLIYRLLDYQSNDLKYALDGNQIKNEFRGKKISNIISIDGAHTIDYKMQLIRIYYKLGVRHIKLSTSNCLPPWVKTEAATPSPKQVGLTDFGKDIIKELNRLGIVIDLAHTASAVQDEVFSTSTAPIIITNVGIKAVADVSGNVPPETLNKLKENKGIVMIGFNSNFLVSDPTKKAGINHVIAHINHVRTQIGVDYVGIAAGFNGENFKPVEGLEDSSKYPILFDRLAKPESKDLPAWTMEELEKLAGGNYLRVLTAAEKVKEDMKSTDANENTIPKEDIGTKAVQCTSKFA